MKFILTPLSIAALGIIVSGCGGGGGGSNSEAPPSENETPFTLSGSILAPDNSTPIAGATVYIPKSTSASVQGVSSSMPQKASSANVRLSTLSSQESCSKPTEEYLAYTCTGPNGSFSLSFNTDEKSLPIKAKKGLFSLSTTASLSGEQNVTLDALKFPAESSLGAAKMAVVTGAFDRMEDILAKLGFGELDSTTHKLTLGSEKFDLYDGTGELGQSYPEFDKMFEADPATGKAYLYNYDIVFINCTTTFTGTNPIIEKPEAIAVVQDYVEKGGRLYVTDQSYDNIEQVFPEVIDFHGSDDTPATEPEVLDQAEVGEDNIVVNSNIHNSQLSSWLSNVTCEGGPCLNEDGTLKIQGFLADWAVMNGAHKGKESASTIWISGEVSWYNADESEYTRGVKPLTITFPYGQGRVLYTSYHTEDEDPSAGFWPQERVLQYLIFEL